MARATMLSNALKHERDRWKVAQWEADNPNESVSGQHVTRPSEVGDCNLNIPELCFRKVSDYTGVAAGL